MAEYSRHRGYYHYGRVVRRYSNGKYRYEVVAILPMDPWTSSKTEARQIAKRLASESGDKIEVYWSDLLDGRLTKSFTVKP